MDDKDKAREEKNLEQPRRDSESRFDLQSESGFFREMDRFFDEYLPRRWWHQFRLGRMGTMSGQPLMPFAGKTPCVDVLNRAEDFLIRAELPGVEKKDINITLSGTTLTLTADTRTEEKEEHADYFRQEICQGAYRRTIELPERVREVEAKATFRNGVLELILPKLPKQEKSQPSTIEVD